jgi:signal transduction histidine kinase
MPRTPPSASWPSLIAGRRVLVSSISGSTAYHILIFSGLAILLGAALARRGRQGPHAAAVVQSAKDPTGERWVFAAGLLTALQALRVLATVWPPASSVLPLLDRLFSVLLPSLLAWAALGPSAGRLADRALAAVLVVAGGLFAVSLLVGSSAPAFNTSILDEVWSFVALAVTGTCLLAIVLRRPPLWGVFAAALGLLVAGQLAHIAILPFTASSAPYVLLAEALAVPVFTIGAVWFFMHLPVGTPSRGDWEDVAATRRLRATAALAAADSASSFADSLTRAVATMTGAEYCLLLTAPEAAGAIAIGAGFDSVRQMPVPAALIDSARCPAITQAMASGKTVALDAGARLPDVRTVLHALGLGGRSPALVVSLPASGKTVAALMLLSPTTQEGCGDSLGRLLAHLAPVFGARLHQWMTPAAPGSPVVDLAQALTEARARITELEGAAARQTAIDAGGLIGLDELRGQLDEALRSIEILEAEIVRLRTTTPTAEMAPPEGATQVQAELALALQALAEARSASGGPSAASPPVASRRLEPAMSIQGARQPLTAISGYTELLLGESIGLLGTTQRRFLERIRAAVQRIDEQLTALAEATHRQPAPSSRAPSELGVLVEEALGVIQPDLRARNLSVRLDLPPSPVFVPGEPDALRTIVARLLTNAADVTPDGREIVLSVLPDAADGLLLLTVSDLGRGVAPADLRRVFTRDVWDEPVPGLGGDPAGLMMVRNLTEALGGRVWVESRPGGTTFSVLLPSTGGAQATGNSAGSAGV